jgi:hypothetical protein
VQVKPDPLWNLPFHFFLKVNWLKTEEAEQLAQVAGDVYGQIRQQLAQIQMLMMPPAPSTPPGAPGGPAPDGSAVDAAVSAGAIHPANASGRPDGSAVDHAVAAGAIHPAAAPAGAVH